MQLEDCAQLSALTGLVLRDAREGYHALTPVLPRLTTLQSLVIADDDDVSWRRAAGAPAHISDGAIPQPGLGRHSRPRSLGHPDPHMGHPDPYLTLRLLTLQMWSA